MVERLEAFAGSGKFGMHAACSYIPFSLLTRLVEEVLERDFFGFGSFRNKNNIQCVQYITLVIISFIISYHHSSATIVLLFSQ